MEIELKYSAEEEQGSRLLEDMASGSGEVLREISMKAIYYDTEDRALKDRRLTYRIRKVGDRSVLTIKYGRGSDKGRDGLHKREEINVPVPDDFIEKPGIDVLEDTPVYKEFDKAVGGQYSDDLGIMLPVKKLMPVITMEFLRREIKVSFGTDSSAILSYDKGNIYAGDKKTEISEVEIELFEGNEDDLTAFGDEISKKYGLKPLNKSK